MDRQTEEFNDKEIINSVLAGNTNAFEDLIKKYKNYVFSIVLKHVPKAEVEEISHEIFLSTYNSLKNFRQTGNFKNWLAKIAVRRAYDYLRKKYLRQKNTLTLIDVKQEQWLESVIAQQSITQAQEAGKKEEAREILNLVLAKLKPKERMILELNFIEELSIKKTAKILNLTEINVKVTSFRARKKLQKIIGQL